MGRHQKIRPTLSTTAHSRGAGHEMAPGLPDWSTVMLADHLDPLKNSALPPNETSPQNVLDAHDNPMAPSDSGSGMVWRPDQVEPLKVRTWLLLSDAAQKLLAGHVMLSR